MATNHTENYALNLWEPTDSFLREEFNENFGKIDAAVGALAAAVNGAIVTGTYVGNGQTAEQHFALGFRPRLLLVAGYGIFCAKLETGGITLFPTTGNGVSTTDLILTDDGFTVSKYERFVNELRSSYDYIAFR